MLKLLLIDLPRRLRNYFTKNNNTVSRNDEALYLHGVNLNNWQYLGYSEIAYNYDKGERVDKANVFLFCGINDTSRRKYVVVTYPNLEDKFKVHPWITLHAELWRTCEKELYDSVNKEPSQYLRDKMLEDHSAVWSNETHWWVTNDTTKYASAKKKQTKKKEILPEEDNVVKVNFKKDKETS